MTWMRSVVGLTVIVLLAGGAFAEDGEAPLEWIAGPTSLEVGDGIAAIDLPSGYVALGAEDTRQLMTLMENPVNGSEMATVAPDAEQGLPWFMVFEWEPIGWVDDSEKEDLDAAGILSSIQSGTEAANEERRKRGWSTLEVVGWFEEPHYDDRTNNLTWAIEARSAGEPLINRMVKLLGRRGVMSVTLVSSPETLAADAKDADALLAGYAFQPGSRYAEFIPGEDDVASYGLTALIAGGAGVALAKSGLLARFWKFLVVGAIAVAGGLKRLFTGRKHIQDPPTQV